MLQHLKYSIPDWILCILASVGLGMNVAQSFLLPEALSEDVLRLTLVCAAVVTVMIVLSYSKITTILSAVAVAAGFIVLLYLAYAGTVTGFTESADAEANGRLWYLMAILCAAAVYLLSRTRITSWLLLIVGALAAAYFQLLEYTVYLWAALLFLFSVGAWICFVRYRRNMMKISAMRTAFVPMALWSAGVSLLCLAVGGLLWWGIVRPLQPPTQDMILLTEYLEYNRIQNLRLVYDQPIFDSSALSDWINENYSEMTDEMENDPEEEQLNADGTQQEEHEEDPNAEDTPPTAEQDGSIDWITYDAFPLAQTIFLGLLLLLVLAGLVVLFLRRRQIWYRRKTKNMDDETYIRFFFAWYLTRFKRLKLPRPGGDTPLEYARRMESSVRFLEDTGVTWAELTEIFARLVYSGRGVQPGDRERFDQFYRGFYRCCRKKMRLAWPLYALRV